MIIINTVPTARNGLTTSVFNYIRNIKMKVDYVSINEPADPVFREIISSRGGNFYVLPNRLNHPIRYFNELKKVLKGQDIMHVHGNSATMAIELFAGFLCGVPKRIAHSHSTRCEFQKADKLLRPFFQMFCTHRAACGEAAGQWLFPGREFEVFNNAIDIEKFRYSKELREAKRQALSIGEKERIYLQIANFDPVKNHEFIIDAFSQFRSEHADIPARLILCGDGTRMKALMTRAEKKNLDLDRDIIFAGPVIDTPAWYSAADYFLLPSKYEGMPMTLIEAQASGIYCLVSENVTRKISYIDKMRFVPLDIGQWVHEMSIPYSYERDRVSEAGIISLRAARYDIKTEAERLRNYYLI